MKRRRYIMLFTIAAFIGLGRPAISQVTPQPPNGTNLEKGLWWLYQLRYDRAHQLFEQYIQEYPEDPAGYFYKTAVDWWHLAQQFDYTLPEVEAALEKDYQNTARVAQALYEKAPDDKTKARAALYWGGAEGLKGRWLITQSQWVKAYFLGKHGHKMLKKALVLDPELYDAYLGLGIYDYFTDTLPGIKGALSALFIHGDKERGLRELQLAIDKGEHSRVEAMIFLIEIYTSEENTPEKALPIATQLMNEFPHSPAMHLARVMTLYTMKDFDRMIPEAKSFVEKSQAETPFYSRAGVRPGHYCLGVAALFHEHNLEKAKKHFDRILEEGVDSSRFVTFALLRLGQIHDLRGERELAIKNYNEVLRRQDFWGCHKEALDALKKPFVMPGVTFSTSPSPGVPPNSTNNRHPAG